MYRTILTFGAAFLVPLWTSAAASAQTAAAAEHVAVGADALAWNDFEPPGFPSGAKIAVIHGDPAHEAPYTVRISLPDGYVIPVHLHGADEHLTVLSGTFRLTMGETWAESRLPSYRAGDFLFIPAGMPHFGGASGPTMVQIHGIGPFTTTVLEPVADE